jgi:hypothetical protein
MICGSRPLPMVPPRGWPHKSKAAQIAKSARRRCTLTDCPVDTIRSQLTEAGHRGHRGHLTQIGFSNSALVGAISLTTMATGDLGIGHRLSPLQHGFSGAGGQSGRGGHRTTIAKQVLCRRKEGVGHCVQPPFCSRDFFLNLDAFSASAYDAAVDEVTH